MKKVLIGCYSCLVGILAVATFVEQAKGTDYAVKNIYHTLWFFGLWAAIAVGTSVVFIRRTLWRRFPVGLLHGSFLLILAGATVTFVTGKKGYIHLRPGVAESRFLLEENGKSASLPFALRLDSFKVEYYPGTTAPSDYVSYTTCLSASGKEISHERIAMNRIFLLHGFRFYQSSFDEDKQGSWLTVNYDRWGTDITYAGYLLFGIAVFGLLFSRREDFRRLLRHPLLRRSGLFVLLLLFPWMGAAQMQSKKVPVLRRVQADSLARRQVIYHDRVAPFNTLARDFLQKLYGKSSYYGLTPEQVMGGWLLCPEAWKKEPIIRIKSKALRRLLNVRTACASLTDLYDGNVYRLQAYWQREQGRGKLAKAIRETDEKIGLILMLERGTLIRPLPDDGKVKPLSKIKLEAELLYNRIPFSKILFMINLTMGIVVFLHWLVVGLYKAEMRRGGKIIGFVFSFTLYGVLLFGLVGYALRWYIGGRIPLSNGYETMLFMALCAGGISALLHRRFPFMLPFGFLLSGFTLLVAYLGQMNPQITPLMPVLVSPLLSIHVSMIMMAYALLAFIMLNGVLALCLFWGKKTADRQPEKDERIAQLTVLSRLMLYPAVFLLGIGIFLGAVWANVSWGRYWAWDPKEVWALITFLVYGAAFHRRDLSLFRQSRFFHIYMIVAFLTVLMTYFGVNYFLGGMHSYADG